MSVDECMYARQPLAVATLCAHGREREARGRARAGRLERSSCGSALRRRGWAGAPAGHRGGRLAADQRGQAGSTPVPSDWPADEQWWLATCARERRWKDAVEGANGSTAGEIDVGETTVRVVASSPKCRLGQRRLGEAGIARRRGSVVGGDFGENTRFRQASGEGVVNALGGKLSLSQGAASRAVRRVGRRAVRAARGGEQ